MTACGTQNICFIFFTETIQSPSTVSSKTHHALYNGFETRHYLEFNVLLFWGTICTIVIGQPGLASVVLVWKHSKSGLQVSELGEILLLGDTGLVPRTVEENSWKKWLHSGFKMEPPIPHGFRRSSLGSNKVDGLKLAECRGREVYC